MTPQPVAYLLAMFGSALGGGARLYVSTLVSRGLGTHFPWRTLAVNLLGCVAVGGVMALVEERQLFAPAVRLFLTVGFLGGFTTFSAFGHSTVELLRGGEARLALANAVANVALGVGAVVLGRAAALALWRHG